MIIYLHGFASSVYSSKAQKFLEYFEEDIIAPSLNYIPNLAINSIEQLIEAFLRRNEKVYLVGSSLGGFYSLYLANKYDLKAVLINPAVNPYDTFMKYEGIEFATSYYDNSRFEFTPSQVKSLLNYQTNTLKNPKNIMTLLQKGDETLDYKEAQALLNDTNLIVEEGGSHSFDDIERYFRKISNFFD
ncbi:MAG: esterase [Arcobacter sp.]|nr:esterase [Arcobacter sp.]